jgi:hypothetical protein
MVAMDTDLVVQMISAHATTALTVKLPGPMLTVQEELAQSEYLFIQINSNARGNRVLS